MLQNMTQSFTHVVSQFESCVTKETPSAIPTMQKLKNVGKVQTANFY